MADFIDCHLWQTVTVSEDELNKLEVVETFLEDSHLMRSLKRCKDCGQLYFYQFREEIDWLAGEDPAYRILIPVRSREEAVRLADEDEISVSFHRPCLEWAWIDTREMPHWVR
jgi:hypothetical protein